MSEQARKDNTKDPEEEDVDGEDEEDEDLEKLQEEIARMEAEAARITKEAEELEKGKKKDGGGEDGSKTENGEEKTTGESSNNNNKPARDSCSIYVGQVDYSATPEELLSHFEACGTVERVTIVCDKFTGKPKGFAYLEFQNEAAVENAVKLDGSEFKGRQLKVTHKRVNQPAFMLQQQASTDGTGAVGRGRGGGFRGRGFRGRGRGRGFRGGFRGRGGGYHPYY